MFYTAFIRTPNSYGLSVNYTVGHGTLQYFKYIFSHPNDAYMVFVCFGNIMILMPIPFIIYSIFNRLNQYLMFALALLIPLLIEGYQYVFKCGNVDIDDIILNALGMIIGYGILQIIIKSKLEKQKSPA